VSTFFQQRGARSLFQDLGFTKKASEPEMGEALLQPIGSATTDEGRARLRTSDNPTSQVSGAFLEHDRHVLRDPHNDAHILPVGKQQSLNTKEAVIRAPLHRTLQRKTIQDTTSDKENQPLDLADLIRRYAINTKIALDYSDLETAAAPTRVVPHEAAKGSGGGFFAPIDVGEEKAPFIGVHPDTPNPNILAHEIGHARFHESGLGKVLQNPYVRGGTTIASPMAAYAAGRFLPGWKAKALGITGAALGLNAPTLISEGVADYKGHKLLKELGATPEELSAYRSDLLGPQASYLLLPAMAGAAGGLGIKKIGAAHRLQGRLKFRNLLISVENRKHSIRKWYDPHAKREGKTVMKYPYGYIRMTEGLDGDHLDCFVGPNEKAEKVYVIMTRKAPDFNKLDEQKCMLGFDSAKEAKRAFLSHYDNPRFFHSMKAIPYEDFERKALSTLRGANKKVAGSTNFDEQDYQRPMGSGPGPTHNQVPGDFLGLPHSSLVGMRHIVGTPLSPKDRIDRQFRYMDEPMGARVLEGNSGALPESPGV
jgi:hypothetical protein